MRGTGFRCAIVLVATLAASTPARAGHPTLDPHAVEAFEAGRALLSQGKTAEACPKFEESVKIMRSTGGLLNLADCYEKLGKTASAWATFQQAESFARKDQDVRSKVARERAAALEPKLVKLTILVAIGVDASSWTIKRDGAPVDRADWGKAVPVDPGSHTVEVSAPGKQTFTKSVDVKGDNASIELQALAAAAPPPAPAATTNATTTSNVTASLEPPKRPGSTQKTISLVVGGVGVAALAVGVAGGLLAMSNLNTAQGSCTSYPTHCNPDHSADGPNGTAQTWATVSTIAFIAAGAAVAGATILYFTAPKAPRSSLALQVAPAVGPSTAGVALGGAW